MQKDPLLEQLKLQALYHHTPPPARDIAFALWDTYHMPSHIREHSSQVAYIAEAIASELKNKNYTLCTESIVISALLHDIAKMYCIQNPQYKHHELGAQWILQNLHHIPIAQGIYYHNYLNPDSVTLPYNILPVIVMYADARVKHDTIVPLHERYDDLLVRYGTTPQKKEYINLVRSQALTMETWLTELLALPIDTIL